MILLNVKLDNIYGFHDFNMNFSYPRKIANSLIDEEWLAERPNFRYKKAIILMGANATGKTTLGKALQSIFNFIAGYDSAMLYKMTPVGVHGMFSVDFVSKGYILHRLEGEICPSDGKNHEINYYYSSTPIYAKDSYDVCAMRLDEMKPEKLNTDGLNKMNDAVGKISCVFSYPEAKTSTEIPQINKELTVKVLRAVIETLDPTLEEVSIAKDLKNAFIIRRENEEIIVQDGKLLNREALSSGTAEGVDIAFFLAMVISGENGFYYCDEHFSYIQSDVEKRIFGLMLDHLGKNEQLIFTTHNSDMLDLNMPKHSFAFLRKYKENPRKVSVTFASDILKRSTDSVHCALENDMFQSIPDDTPLNDLEKGCLYE